MKYFTYAEAAAELPCFEYWLRNNISRLPHQKLGRKVTFSEDDIAAIRRLNTQSPVVTEDADGRLTRRRNSHPARRAS